MRPPQKNLGLGGKKSYHLDRKGERGISRGPRPWVWSRLRRTPGGTFAPVGTAAPSAHLRLADTCAADLSWNLRRVSGGRGSGGGASGSWTVASPPELAVVEPRAESGPGGCCVSQESGAVMTAGETQAPPSTPPPPGPPPSTRTRRPPAPAPRAPAPGRSSRGPVVLAPPEGQPGNCSKGRKQGTGRRWWQGRC